MTDFNAVSVIPPGDYVYTFYTHPDTPVLFPYHNAPGVRVVSSSVTPITDQWVKQVHMLRFTSPVAVDDIANPNKASFKEVTASSLASLYGCELSDGNYDYIKPVRDQQTKLPFWAQRKDWRRQSRG